MVISTRLMPSPCQLPIVRWWTMSTVYAIVFAFALIGDAECVASSRLEANEAPAKLSAGSRAGASRQSPETSVWTGVYTEEQAIRGEQIYGRRCRKCHRRNLSGDGALQGDGSEVVPSLVGLSFEFRWDRATLADLFLTVSRAMPWDAPGTLSPQDNVDVVSYLLKMNGIPPGDSEAPTDTKQLGQIRVTTQPPGD